ncbi:hypothetical protein ACFY1C_33480 [Streptomyces sp. NPDC001279]|uniref:hypothetical protein n=1 Tax=Streptomyces sp. NPDC001279 TaxID=3364556 RepID=UPI0036D138C9
MTFAEQVPGLTVRYQRRTPQLQHLVEAVGVVLAGRGGARMLRILNITLSRCTVLSQLMRVPLPPLETPRVPGVDDFALYGGTYGTLLVDATTWLPLTLWEGHDAEQLSHWLREHPGVEVACRDGSLTYRQGITPAHPTPRRSATAFTSGRVSPAASRTSPPPTAVAWPNTATRQGDRSRTGRGDRRERRGGHPGRAPRPKAVRGRA